MGRLEQLQAEVQKLTGKVDEQAYRIDELKKHQSTMYSDFDERLQNIENKANGTDQAITESPSETASTVMLKLKRMRLWHHRHSLHLRMNCSSREACG